MITAPDWWFIGTFAVASLGIVVAAYRGWTDRKQENTARQGMLDERFKMAVDLVRRENLAARVGGIHVLAAMAKLYPEYNHVRVMEIFVSLLPRRMSELERVSVLNEGAIDYGGTDVDAIRNYIENRKENQIEAEKKSGFCLEDRLSHTEYKMKSGKLVWRGSAD